VEVYIIDLGLYAMQILQVEKNAVTA